MTTLYSMPSSGNSYKVRLLLALLNTPYTHIGCEADTPELQAAKDAGKLPLGKLPALHLESDEILNESNAILWYLAQGTDWIPSDALQQSRMLAWMFFEQNRHEPVIAVRASLNFYPSRAHLATPERMGELFTQGQELLALMDDGLRDTNFLAGDTPSLADIALYAYTHTAGERGGFDLAPFANLRGWLERIKSLENYIELDDC